MRILIGVDGSGASSLACEFVAGRTWPIGTRIDLVSVIPPSVPHAKRTAARDRLDRIVEQQADALRHRSLAVSITILDGEPATALVNRAREEFVSLIVVGNRGLGPIGAALIGSVSAHLIDHAPCPVLVARSPSAARMVIASDGTHSSLSIPRILATWRPAFNGLPVEVVSVAPHQGFVTPWEPEGDIGRVGHVRDIAMHREISERVVDQLIDLGWHAAGITVVGDPGSQIIAASREWHADLIVTGSRGLGTIRRLLQGSVSHYVMTHARSSVLVVRGQVAADIRQPELVRGAAPA